MNAKNLPALLAVVIAVSVAPLRAADGGGCLFRSAPSDHPGAVPILLGLDSVRKELHLSAAQAGRLDEIRSDFKARARQLTARTPTNPSERRSAGTHLAHLRTTANAQALAVLTPAQRCRLAQIEYQVLGGTMLLSPSVQKSLGLSPVQIARIGRLEKKGIASAGAVNRRFENGEISHHERLAILRAHRIKQAEALVRLLTPAQRQTLNTLRGNPVKNN